MVGVIQQTVVPTYNLVDPMNTDVVDILPTVHNPTGCDVKCKICSKAAAFEAANEYGYELLIETLPTDRELNKEHLHGKILQKMCTKS